MSASDLDGALRAWRAVVGEDHVLTDAARRRSAETATFATRNAIPAIVRPADRAAVQECVRIANRHRTPIHPSSGGKNWGYGSRVPARDGCVLLDLGRLDRVVDFSETLSYITVEPGVTFRQVADYLAARRSALMINATGSTPDASVVGNTMERGLGFGPYRDRASYVCGMEVVLPTGELIQTGFERFAGAKAARLHRWGVGPWLDGLFTQANLGIVTRLTSWLNRRPKHFTLARFTLFDADKLGGLVDALRALGEDDAIDLRLSNEYRALSRSQQYPWKETGGRTPLPAHVLSARRRAKWSGHAGIYAHTGDEARARRRAIRRALGPHVDRLDFVGAVEQAAARALAKPLARLGLDVGAAARLSEASAWVGVPDTKSLETAYWRKRTPMPSDPDPDRDRCGIIWCCPVVPFQSGDVLDALRITEAAAWAHGFEPNVNLRPMSPRVIDLVVAILFDRDVPGEDERALACSDAILRELGANGYFPYRLGLQGMASLPAAADDHGALMQRLKAALDPNDILSPGRYDFREHWPGAHGDS